MTVTIQALTYGASGVALWLGFWYLYRHLPETKGVLDYRIVTED